MISIVIIGTICTSTSIAQHIFPHFGVLEITSDCVNRKVFG